MSRFEICQTVREAITKHGNHSDIARQTGIDLGTVSRIANRRATPSFAAFCKLADYLGLGVYEEETEMVD